MAEKVALCYIEHDGVTYNYGDPVPDEVIEAHPSAVGVPNPSQADIDKMTKAELQEHLLRLTGQEGDQE